MLARVTSGAPPRPLISRLTSPPACYLRHVGRARRYLVPARARDQEPAPTGQSQRSERARIEPRPDMTRQGTSRRDKTSPAFWRGFRLGLSTIPSGWERPRAYEGARPYWADRARGQGRPRGEAGHEGQCCFASGEQVEGGIAKPRQCDGAQVGRWVACIEPCSHSDQRHRSYDADPDNKAAAGLVKQ